MTTNSSRHLSVAIEYINKNGFLLVFPIQNQERPQSLWSCLYPGEKMRWEWDDSADNKVVNLWILRENLARSREVVYGKFYKNRATFFSRRVFTLLLAICGSAQASLKFRESKRILEALELDSPLSTKQIKVVAELRGKFFEPAYNKAMRELWQNFLVVGLGEIDDGAFPSLAHAATQVVFEDLWHEAQTLDPVDSYLELLELPDFELLESILSSTLCSTLSSTLGI